MTPSAPQPLPSRPRQARLLGLACLALSLSGETLADGPSQAARLKAAFIFNFTKYTDWPAASFAAADAPLWVCVLRTDSDMGQALQGITGRASKGRSLQLRRVDAGTDLKTCHVLFLEREPAMAQQHSLSRLGNAPVLTVGDAEGFAEQGGMIEFEASGQRLGFAINLDVAQRAGLRLSAQLLSLARIVKDS
ncbi:MAG: YfiR family protein [Gammaproteobacteria bacterium]|nr:YfiR family protein [Gammaproteobacteria bacterium]